MNTKYCTQCGELVAKEENEEFHDSNKEWAGLFCEGPFFEMAPPEMTEEFWDVTLERDYTVYEEEMAWEPEI